MLSLKSFHVVFIALSIIITAGFGMWGVLNSYRLSGAVSLAVSGALVIYGAYFAAKAERIHLE
jgi:hypothetical protein